MKGAVNVISIILISGIVISLIGAVYLWSFPLLEKGRTSTLFQASTSFVLDLNKEIVDIANAGGGTASMDIPPGMAITLYPFDATGSKNNSLTAQISISQPLAMDEGKTYLGGASYLDVKDKTTGTFGESSPSIISFELSALGTGYIGTFEILYRKLTTKTIPVKTRQIVLNQGSDRVVRGESRITVTFDRNIQSGPVTLSNILVQVS